MIALVALFFGALAFGATLIGPQKILYFIAQFMGSDIVSSLASAFFSSTQSAATKNSKGEEEAPVKTPNIKEELCREILEKKYNLPFPNVRPDWLVNPLTGRRLELDCYNEQLSIAVEYNGYQHYVFPNRFHKSKEEFDRQQARDKLKQEMCKQRGIKLVIVPYTITKKQLESHIERELAGL